MGLDDGADVGGQSRVLVLAALPAARGEVLQAADAVMALVQPLLDGLAPPAEASLGLAGVAAAELGGDLGLERAALVSGERLAPERIKASRRSTESSMRVALPGCETVIS